MTFSIIVQIHIIPSAPRLAVHRIQDRRHTHAGDQHVPAEAPSRVAGGMSSLRTPSHQVCTVATVLGNKGYFKSFSYIHLCHQ